jgi:hypothetical protein
MYSEESTQDTELLRQMSLMFLPPNCPAEILTASRIDKPIAKQTTTNIYPDYGRCLRYILLSGKCLNIMNIFLLLGEV